MCRTFLETGGFRREGLLIFFCRYLGTFQRNAPPHVPNPQRHFRAHKIPNTQLYNMPNQDRTFVIEHPELPDRHVFTGHEPKQAASKAFTHLRKNKKAGKGKTVFIIRETGSKKELTYTGEYKKRRTPLVITRADGSSTKYEYESTVNRMEDRAAAKVKRTSHSKKRSASKSKRSSKSATRRK